MPEDDTIFALSSGQPPAAIAIIRISGPAAKFALQKLSGAVPADRVACVRKLTAPDSGKPLDTALVLWFPGPDNATGEDLAELHVHGGRAVVRAIESVLTHLPGLRPATAGEFTRRAFLNGRIDMAEAEGLADLLAAETELHRQNALSLASGKFSGRIDQWRAQILQLSALVEAELDFSDEDDVAPRHLEKLYAVATDLRAEMMTLIDAPSAEKLREGISVVLAGPPNAGKSTLLNALVEQEAAIVSEIAGTTRDVIRVPMALNGIPFVFTDTAGLRTAGADTIENIGMEKAQNAIASADIILWLGPEDMGPDRPQTWEVEAQIDRAPPYPKTRANVRFSAHTGLNMDVLVRKLCEAARELLPRPGEFAINARQKEHLARVTQCLEDFATTGDLLLMGEELRNARLSLDALLGRTHTEDMLDTLFGKFCIGK